MCPVRNGLRYYWYRIDVLRYFVKRPYPVCNGFLKYERYKTEDLRPKSKNVKFLYFLVCQTNEISMDHVAVSTYFIPGNVT